MLLPIYLFMDLFAFALTAADCTQLPTCTVLAWHPWPSCVCGQKTQLRLRDFCCMRGITTRADCVRNCSLSVPWNETRYCPQNCLHGILIQNGNACQCLPGYRGKCCDELIKCQDSPCLHGICQDAPQGYTCACPTGYSGKNCETAEPVSSEQYRPPWLQGTEIAVVVAVPVIGMMALGCCCYNLFLCCKSRDQDEDDNKTEPYNKNRQKLRLPQPRALL